MDVLPKEVTDQMLQAALEQQLGTGRTGQFFVELVWQSPQEIQALNNTHRQIDKATDVLSFPTYTYQELEPLLAQAGDAPILLGTLVLCEAVLRDHASINNRSFEDEVQWSIDHGLRHLLGYDHNDAGEDWKPIIT